MNAARSNTRDDNGRAPLHSSGSDDADHDTTSSSSPASDFINQLLESHRSARQIQIVADNAKGKAVTRAPSNSGLNARKPLNRWYSGSTMQSNEDLDLEDDNRQSSILGVDALGSTFHRHWSTINTPPVDHKPTAAASSKAPFTESKADVRRRRSSPPPHSKFKIYSPPHQPLKMPKRRGSPRTGYDDESAMAKLDSSFATNVSLQAGSSSQQEASSAFDPPSPPRRKASIIGFPEEENADDNDDEDDHCHSATVNSAILVASPDNSIQSGTRQSQLVSSEDQLAPSPSSSSSSSSPSSSPSASLSQSRRRRRSSQNKRGRREHRARHALT